MKNQPSKVRSTLSLTPAVAAMLLSSGSMAQELFKCTDGITTTYSSTACEKLGLKPSGPIRDRLTVINNGPAPQKPAAPAPSQGTPAAQVPAPGAGSTSPAPAPAQTAAGAATTTQPVAAKAAGSIDDDEKRARRAATGIKPVSPLIDRLAR